MDVIASPPRPGRIVVPYTELFGLSSLFVEIVNFDSMPTPPRALFIVQSHRATDFLAPWKRRNQR